MDDEKTKREARNRLAAARKQAKLRQKQLRDEEEANKNSPDNSLNSSLNSSLNVSFEVLNENPESMSTTPVEPEMGEQASSLIINSGETNGQINGHDEIKTNGEVKNANESETNEEALATSLNENCTINGSHEEQVNAAIEISA